MLRGELAWRFDVAQVRGLHPRWATAGPASTHVAACWSQIGQHHGIDGVSRIDRQHRKSPSGRAPKPERCWRPPARLSPIW